VDDSGHQ
jgi:Zn-dependent M16 (insulinase) family peptidase